MLTDANRKISIIAYFLSKFDKDALKILGYDTFASAFKEISKRFGKSNNYMKLRRDEFDALVSTSRQGWNKRAPASGVVLMHNDLKNFSFEELSNIVNSLLIDDDIMPNRPVLDESDEKIIKNFSESEYESIINATDPNAGIKQKSIISNVRVYDRKIPDGLKKLYNYRCQICGSTATVAYGVDVSEAHHIDYFTKSMNNNPDNIVILCPDHHRIIHKGNAVFDHNTHVFTYDNSKTDSLLLNLHL